MESKHTGSLEQILRTTLHLVERRGDLDQQAPSIRLMKDSMRKTIAELEEKKSNEATPAKKAVRTTEPKSRRSWTTRALKRMKKRMAK